MAPTASVSIAGGVGEVGEVIEMVETDGSGESVGKTEPVAPAVDSNDTVRVGSVVDLRGDMRVDVRTEYGVLEPAEGNARVGIKGIVALARASAFGVGSGSLPVGGEDALVAVGNA